MASFKNETIGSLPNTAASSQGVSLSGKDHQASIEYWRDDIARITVKKSSQDTPLTNYGIHAQPLSVSIANESSTEGMTLRSSKLKVKISTDPFRVQFLTDLDQLIHSDDPAFGVSWLGDEVCRYVSIQEGERFLGLGEKTGNMDRRGTAYQNWNTDYFGYPADGDPLYATIPFYVGVHHGLMYGIYFNNTHRSRFNFGASNRRFAFYTAESGVMDYFFFTGQSIAELIEAYTWLTGRPFLPPKWALGFQQCRYSYYPEHEVISLADNFRQRQIPADVIYFDIHYMDKYKVFTWDQDRFPDPKGMHERLKQQNFKTVVMVDPGVKIEDGYPVYQSALSSDAAVKYPDGAPYEGEVWPGWCIFPDYTKPETRQWWGEQYKVLTDDGIGGFWNDMNEPATWGQDMPDLIEFDFDGEGATHKQARNVYGLQMARSTFEGVSKLRPQERPFVLTRAGFSGIQRFAAMWTGDNVASDEHMMAGIRLVLSLSISGVPFSGFDIGGFVGDASPALYKRWIAAGALMPFSRGHSMINSKDSEPWSYGEETEEVARNYISFRYQLMPLFYSLFYRSTLQGSPIVSPLAYHWPHDARSYQGIFQNQFLVGDSLMACPVESHADYVKVFLPKGSWYDLYTGTPHAGDQTMIIEAPKERMPIFVKAGTILPTQKVTQHTAEKVDTLELHLYPGETSASLVLFEDGGNGYSYLENQDERYELKLEAQTNGLFNLSITCQAAKSSYSRIKFFFHGEAAKSAKTAFIKRAGNQRYKRVSIHQADFSFFKPLSAFDPFYSENDCYGREYGLPYAEMPWKGEDLLVEVKA